MTLTERFRALCGSVNGYKALKDELEETRGDLKLSQLKVEELQSDLDRRQEEYENMCAEYDALSIQMQDAKRNLKAYRSALFSFRPKLETTEEMKRFYECVAPQMDADGYRLYFAAKKLTGVECYRVFPYEDARGTFEQAGGHQLMKYLTAYRFDAVEWSVVPGTCYESASLLPVDTSTPEYRAFERQVYQEALCSMGFQELLPDHSQKEKEKTDMKKGDDTR